MTPGKRPGNDPISFEGRLFEEFPPRTLEDWRLAAERGLRGASPEEALKWETREGIIVKPIYAAEDVPDPALVDGVPGSAPFARGSLPFRDPARSWAVAQEAGDPDPAAANKAIREDLAGGGTAVNLILDRAFRLGLDPDRAPAGDVGRGGVSVASRDDLDRVFEDVDLGKVPVYLHPGASGLPALAFLVAAAKGKGVDPSGLRGAVAMDPLGALALDGVIPLSLAAALDEMAAATAWAEAEAPGLATIWVHGEVFHNGGGHAVQELAFALATAVFYLRAMEERGIAPERCARRMCFSFAAGSRFFVEAARLRAARVVWNRVLESCGVPEEERCVWIHGRTSARSAAFLDPHVNMLRAVTQILSGVLGGADSLCAAPFDSLSGAPAGSLSRRIARNTHLILGREAHLGRVLDPAGGAWFVEKLTGDIARAAWRLFREVERRGGMARALAEGFPQADVARTAAQRAGDAARLKHVMVGVNRYPGPAGDPLEPLPFEGKSFSARRGAVARAARAAVAGTAALADIAAVLPGDRGGLVRAVIAAAAAGSTLGAMGEVLASRRGPSARAEAIPLRRPAAPFEALRAAFEKHRRRGGSARVVLASLGPEKGTRERVDFIASFFEAGGLETLKLTEYDRPEEAAKAVLAARADVAVIVGAEGAPVSLGASAAAAIKRGSPGVVAVLAGFSAGEEPAAVSMRAGVDLFFHEGIDLVATLNDLAARMGVDP